MHNLRSALDLWMSYQVGATEKSDQHPRVYFPICTSGKDFRNWRKSVEGRVDQVLVEVIRRHQPFVLQLPHRNWLLGLSDLNNADKHRVMMSVDFGYTDNLHVEVSPLPPQTELPHIDYSSYLVSATVGGLVVDLKSEAPIDIEVSSVTMDAFFELDGTKHELIQNVRGFHESVQRLLMQIQRQVAIEHNDGEKHEANSQAKGEE